MKYQLPAGSKIKLVALRVADLDSMIDFYTQIIGMTSIKRTENTSYLGTSDHQISLTLRRVASPEQHNQEANISRFAFKFPTSTSLKQLLLHVKNLGVKLGEIKYNHNFEWIDLTDPEGNHVVLYAEINGIVLVDDHSIQWMHKEEEVIAVNRFLRDEDTRIKRMPAEAKLTWMEFAVSDMAASLRFYQDLLGLAVLPNGKTDTKTLVLPADHSQQIVLNEVPGLADHNYCGLGIDYLGFQMVRAQEIDDLDAVINAGGSANTAHYDSIDHLLFLNDPNQINLTFSVL